MKNPLWLFGICLFGGICINFNPGLQAAQIVHDPTTAANVMSSVNAMTSMLNVTNQVQSRLFDLNSSVGTSLEAISNPVLTALQLFGRCGDPFSGLKSSFLGMSKLNPSFDFCNLIEGKKAYTNLLFIPFDLIGQELTHQRHNEILQARQQVIQEASVNTLAMAAQQKQGINEMRKRIVSLSQRAEKSPNMREDLRTNNQLLSVIANELVNLRALMVHQAEIQASLAANQIPVAFNGGH